MSKKTVQIRVRLSSAVEGSAAQVKLTEDELALIKSTAASMGFGTRAVSTFIRHCGEVAAGPSENYTNVHALLVDAASRSGLSLGSWLRIVTLSVCKSTILSEQLNRAGGREEIEKQTAERIRAKLEAFQTSCERYMAKAVWRELDTLVVELGGEHRPYKFT